MTDGAQDAPIKRFGNWAAKNWVSLVSLVGTVTALFAAFDAHNVAKHAEENTSAQLQIVGQPIDNEPWLVISNEGDGAANFVRVVCVLKTQQQWSF
jgi:hypothetical protein